MKCFWYTLMLSGLALSLANAASEQQMVNESKQAIKSFAEQLQGKLMAGMQEGGPVAAIKVCNTAAEEIASKVSEHYGWKLSRTALKFRNANNAPEPWQEKILKTFEQRQQKGEAVSNIDHAEVVSINGQSTFRYMKAIPTGGLCLSCHGDGIAPEISNKLDQLYPDDKARGFKLGDIRGAFSIVRAID